MADPHTVSRDAFLGGKVTAEQPVAGYRAGTDAVFLAAAVPTCAGETVLELGCGVGVASLCLAARVPGVAITGLERDAAMAQIARRNVKTSAASITVVDGDLADMPKAVRALNFHHVMMNPPYFRNGTAAKDVSRTLARHEDTPLPDWIDAGIRRLHPKGTLTLIHETARLREILIALDDRMGAIRIRPLTGRQGRPADRVIVSAQKGARTAPRLEAPFVLHEGLSHSKDGDSYSAAARAVLRDGAALR